MVYLHDISSSRCNRTAVNHRIDTFLFCFADMARVECDSVPVLDHNESCLSFEGDAKCDKNENVSKVMTEESQYSYHASKKESNQASHPLKYDKYSHHESKRESYHASNPLKDLPKALDPDMIKGVSTSGDRDGCIQIGNNNVMNISYSSHTSAKSTKSTNSKKVITLKDLTSSRKFASDEVCEYVSQHVGNCWRKLGRHLELSDGQLDALHSDFAGSMTETIYQMLRQWRNQQGLAATLHSLAVSLARAGKGAVALHLSTYE